MDGTRVSMMPEVKEEMQNYPRPNSTPSLRRFLGKMNVYRHFIQGTASIAAPLYEHKNPYARFEWTDTMESAFQELKIRLVNAISIFHPDYSLPFILETDASDTGVGATLLQLNNQHQWVLICWISRKLSPAERNYGITEPLAVVWAIKNLDYILRGWKLSIITDHKALAVIRSKDDYGNPRMNQSNSGL